MEFLSGLWDSRGSSGKKTPLKFQALGGRETDWYSRLIFIGLIRASRQSMHGSKGAWLRVVSQTAAWHYIIALIAFLVSFFVRDLLNDWLIGISDRGLIILGLRGFVWVFL